MAPYCIIAIVNQKGGVGKTTTAINMSACLGYFGFETLLIDADAQANSTIGLGLDPKQQKNTFYDFILNDCSLKDAVVQTEYSGLSILPSSNDLYAADIELSKEEITGYGSLESKLKDQISNYDFIVFDSPPHIGPLTLNMMKAADTLIVPLKADFFALQGMALLTKTLNMIKSSFNPKIMLKGVLLTMYNQNINLCKEVEEDVKKFFGDILFDTKIPQNVTLAEAPSHGKPIIYYNFKSSGSENYRLFTSEFLKKMQISGKGRNYV
jgi:chromosome partitioning protein